ncbi:erythromycin esterase family protein [Stackebrandtia nassauensis]|uniref:Erythromycin esterase n=1 Tax=Stackebrandtia nassauensis (strain DSM 44728 / CIP 108903 / NRRL B-16338 / NBRC 102104 / LLR-40K-21) TaxID=446470 RepID=D3PXK9_STANL|nr:erythromycin esterase family protein [Stackebrandtia nassauensis]ADD43339.1 Erythromycin esterase [Stackebrandtia nassauensis DSM 44728]
MTQPDQDPQRQEFIQWARTHGHPLTGADGDPDVADLAPLSGVVGDARLVGLGETWHPVHEFLALHFRMTQYLIEHKGFTAVLLEGSLATARHLDDYVQGRRDDLSDVAVSSLWENAETVSFMDWLREHNAALPPHHRVRIFGLDNYFLIMEDVTAPGTGFEAVLEYLRRVDPDDTPPHLDVVRQVFSGFATDAASPTERRKANFSYFGTLDIPTRDRFRAALDHIIERLTDNRTEYLDRTDAEDFAWALHRATVIRQAQDMYETLQQSFADGLAEHVRAIVHNVQWCVDQLGDDGKAVILATGVHLTRGPWTYTTHDTPIPSVGALLSETYGDDLVVLSTCFGSGRFDPPNLVTGTVDIPEAAADSLDTALAATGAAALLVDLRGRTSPPPPVSWLSTPHPLRPMQNVANPPRYRLAEALDAVIYIDHVHAHQPRH